MGVYFIAAGSSTRNRQKSLDKFLWAEKICHLLPENVHLHLEKHFSSDNRIFAWGANR